MLLIAYAAGTAGTATTAIWHAAGITAVTVPSGSITGVTIVRFPKASTTRSALPAGTDPAANAASTGWDGFIPAALYAKVSVTATPNTCATVANAAAVSVGTAATLTVAATAWPSAVTTACAGLYFAVTAIFAFCAGVVLESLLLLEADALPEPPPDDLWLLDFLELLELLLLLVLVLVLGVFPLLEPFPGLSAAKAVKDMEAINIAAVAIAKNFFMMYLLLPHD